MAYKNNRRYGKSTKKKSKYTEVERIAYQMGRVKRGLSNPNSRVFESYQNGCKGKTTTNKKPLF